MEINSVLNQESVALTFNFSMSQDNNILGGLQPLAVVAKGPDDHFKTWIKIMQLHLLGFNIDKSKYQ